MPANFSVMNFITKSIFFLGDMSWVMRIQNQLTSLQSIYEFPLNEISSLVMPSLSQAASCEYEGSEGICRNEESTQEEEYASSSMPISIPGKISELFVFS